MDRIVSTEEYISGEERQHTAQTWRMAAQDDSDTIARTLNNMKDSTITREDIRILKEAQEDLRRNVLAMEVALEVGE